MSSYSKDDYTIVKDVIIVEGKTLNETYDQLLEGFQSNKYRIGVKTEIAGIREPHHIILNIYDMVRENDLEIRRFVEIQLNESEGNIVVDIQVFGVQKRESRFISNLDVSSPMIIEEISMNLTGSIDPELYSRLFPPKHRSLVKFEDRLGKALIVFGVISWILMENVYYWYVVFGAIGIFAMYNLIDLMKNERVFS